MSVLDYLAGLYQRALVPLLILKELQDVQPFVRAQDWPERFQSFPEEMVVPQVLPYRARSLLPFPLFPFALLVDLGQDLAVEPSLGRWLCNDEKVLFLSGNRTDVRSENLALVTAAELRAQTLGESAAPVSDADRKYCSASCAARASRRFDISWEELEKLVWEMPATQVAALFEVLDKAVEKRCKKHGIRKPPRGCWAQVNGGRATRS